MNITVGPIFSKLETTNLELLSKLIELYSFTDPKSYYTRGNYRAPKKQFISPNGKFLSGLLTKILEDLKLIECFPKIINEDNESIAIKQNYDVGEYKLKDYQLSSIQYILEKKRGIIKLPTGSGKTVIMAAIVNEFKDKKCLILVPNKLLVYQTYKVLKECNIDCGLATGKDFILSNIMVINVQSIHKIIGHPIENPDIFIVDECHSFSNGAFAKKILKAIKSPIRIGLTATLPKDKIALYSIIGLLGEPIEIITTKQLTEEGSLTKCFIQIIPIHYNQSLKNFLYGSHYTTLYENYIVKNQKRNEAIKTICDQIPNSKESKVLILVNKLQHVVELMKLIPNAIQLQGKDENEFRQEEITKFSNSDKKEILIGTKILETGVNIPEITHFINARGLKSEIATIQALGRSLRVHKNKKKVFVFDFLDELKILEVHSRKRISTYKKEKHEISILPGINYYGN